MSADGPDVTSCPKLDATKLADAGLQAFYSHDWVTALNMFDKAAILDPSDPSHNFNCAAIYFDAKDFYSSESKCDSAIDTASLRLQQGSLSDAETYRMKNVLHRAYMRKGRLSLFGTDENEIVELFKKAYEVIEGINVKSDHQFDKTRFVESKTEELIAITLSTQPMESKALPPLIEAISNKMKSLTAETSWSSQLPRQPFVKTVADLDHENKVEKLAAGKDVELIGLSNVKFNHAKGRVVAVTADGKRLIVKLKETNKEISVKPSNCAIINNDSSNTVKLAMQTYKFLEPGSGDGNSERLAEALANAEGIVLLSPVELHGLMDNKYNGLEGTLLQEYRDGGIVLVHIGSPGNHCGERVLVKLQNMRSADRDKVQRTKEEATKHMYKDKLHNATASETEVVPRHSNQIEVDTNEFVSITDVNVVEEEDEALSFESLLKQFKEEDQAKKGKKKKARKKNTSTKPKAVSDMLDGNTEMTISTDIQLGSSQDLSPDTESQAQPATKSSKKKKKKKKKKKGGGASSSSSSGGNPEVITESGPTAPGNILAIPNPNRPPPNGEVIKVEVRHEGLYPKTTLSTGRPITGGSDPMYTGISPKDDMVGTKAKLIKERRDEMEMKEKMDKLSLQDVADYEIFVQGLVSSMEADKLQIARKYRMSEAKLKLARDPKRVQMLSNEIDSLKRREKRFNEDVALINETVDQFHSSAAFKMARKHVLENFVEQGGTWVNKKTLEEDEVDFESLLREMKGGSEAGPA